MRRSERVDAATLSNLALLGADESARGNLTIKEKGEKTNKDMNGINSNNDIDDEDYADASLPSLQ